MRKKFIIVIVISFIILTVFIVFVMVPAFSSKTVSRQYTVDSIYVGGVKDIIFSNQEDSVLLYINRGLEQYSINYFQSRLLHKPTIFTFSLNESYKVNPIIRIECDGEVIYEF